MRRNIHPYSSAVYSLSYFQPHAKWGPKESEILTNALPAWESGETRIPWRGKQVNLQEQERQAGQPAGTGELVDDLWDEEENNDRDSLADLCTEFFDQQIIHFFSFINKVLFRDWCNIFSSVNLPCELCLNDIF